MHGPQKICLHFINLTEYNKISILLISFNAYQKYNYSISKISNHHKDIVSHLFRGNPVVISFFQSKSLIINAIN